MEDRLRQILERSKSLEKELEELKSKMASASGDELAGSAVEINGIKVLAARMDDVDPKALRDTVDRLKDQPGKLDCRDWKRRCWQSQAGRRSQ